MHITDSIAYEHTVVATQLNVKRKYTSYTLVHNSYSGTQNSQWYTTRT